MGSGATQATRVPFLAAPASHATGPNTLETWVLSHVQNRLKAGESLESPLTLISQPLLQLRWTLSRISRGSAFLPAPGREDPA